MPGKRMKNTRNRTAHAAWIAGKKVGRPKQIWVNILTPELQGTLVAVKIRDDSGQVPRD